MKKTYIKPEVKTIKVQAEQALLTGSTNSEYPSFFAPLLEEGQDFD